MNEKRPEESTGDENTESDELIWLLGQPRLSDYLDFVQSKVVGGKHADRAALTDEWRAANDYYHELEECEAGIADQAECLDLDPALAPLAEEVMSSHGFRSSFDTLPTSLGMVELDRLVVYQNHVTRQFVESLKSRLGPDPDREALFRFCLPLGRPEAPVQIQRVGSHRFVFWAESTDFRFHEAVLLQPDQVRDYNGSGPVTGIVGLVVGFGTNLLNVVRADNRLILHNGYHRACALRTLGVTHAPCIIQTVTRMDELDVAASQDVMKSSAFYLKTARPPLLKDFFDPKIRKVLTTPKIRRMIEVKFEVQDFLVTE